MSIWTKNADYLEQILPEYRMNPLIEALPEIMSKEDTLACLTREPDHDDEERNLEAKYLLIVTLFEVGSSSVNLGYFV